MDPVSVGKSGSWSQRAWGGVKAAGGALEVAAGLASGAAASWTGVGAAAGGVVALHGGDSVVSGVREMWQGRETPTFTSQGISAITGSRAAGEIADAGLGLAGTFGAGAFSRAAASEPLVSKAVYWTADLPAGSGMTGPFGDILVSKLGSKIDRMQVLLHEKVHSFLSPSASALFARMRADLRTFLYTSSDFMRYAEEALAESFAQLKTISQTGRSGLEAVWSGLAFPLEYGYVGAKRLAAEACGVLAKLAGSGEQVWNAK